MSVNEFELIPFKGVDAGDCFFELGKTMKQIIKQHGEAGEVIHNNILKMIFETRNSCQLKYKKNKLVSIACSKHTNPMFNGLNLFEAESIEKLKQEHEFLEGKYYITFPALGICVGGMSQKKIPEGKLAIVFVEDELEGYKFFAKD